MIGLSRAWGLAAALTVILSAPVLAQDQARPAAPETPRTIPDTPREPQDPSAHGNQVEERCTGQGRRRVCRYLLICHNNLLAGTFSSEAEAFNASWTRCPPRTNHLTPGTLEPDRSAPRREPGATPE